MTRWRDGTADGLPAARTPVGFAEVVSEDPESEADKREAPRRDALPSIRQRMAMIVRSDAPISVARTR
ncbi:MAG TPA: hypothetical protein DCQ98_03930 [Planctomycetaceae bacterium]|nr:hypothetical protein [Planctomycetaceae bacterium]